MTDWRPNSGVDVSLPILAPPGVGLDSPNFIRLPRRLRETIIHLADVQQVGASLALMNVLGMMSVAGSPLRNVELPFGRQTPTSLYLVATAATSERKSSTLSLIQEGINEVQLLEDDRFRRDKLRYEIERKAHQRKLKIHEADPLALEELIEAQPILRGHWTIMSAAATAAGLSLGLSQGPGSTALVSCEGGEIFNRDMIENLGDFNAYFSGEGKRRLLGSHRSSIPMARASLSLVVLTQPSTFDDFERAHGQQLEQSGFRSRVLFANCPNFSGERSYRAPLEVEKEALRWFNDRCKELLLSNFEAREWQCVKFTEQSAQQYEQYTRYLEKGRQPGAVGSDIAGFLGKAGEQAARLAALISLFDENRGAIGADHFASAADLMSFFFVQAKRRYGSGALGQMMEEEAKEALQFLIRCRSSGDHPFPFARWLQFAPNRLRSGEVRDRALMILQQRGQITIAKTGKAKFIWVNPNVYG